MTNDAANFVGSIPENYDWGLGPHIFQPFADDLARRVQAIAPGEVLELAAGTGIVSRAIRAVLPSKSQLVVTDLNEPMLEIAEAKVGSAETTRFRKADGCDLPFGDDVFDLVVNQFGVMFFPDKAKSFEEARRVLRPGGTYIFNAWGSWASNPFARISHEIIARNFPDDPPGFYAVPFSYNDRDEISQALKSAEFAEVGIEQVRFSDPIKSLPDFAQGLIFGNPVSQEVEARGGDCAEICRELEDELDRQLGGILELEALVVTAS